jgi:hypothetical protein
MPSSPHRDLSPRSAPFATGRQVLGSMWRDFQRVLRWREPDCMHLAKAVSIAITWFCAYIIGAYLLRATRSC